MIKKLGPDSGLDIVPMDYYPNLKASTLSLFQPTYPTVVKVSSTHAGYGKIQAETEADMKDVKCILALHNDYYTTEPFVAHEYEFRVQKIGNHYRSFRRNSSTHWKNNWGNLTFIDHPWDSKYKIWADEVAKLFGGLDIVALDVLHTKDNKDFLLEINDTAPGLMYEHETEDIGYLRDLVIQRMTEHYCQ